MGKRHKGFGVLPASIHRDPSLTCLAKCVLLDLSQHAGADDSAFPKVQVLAAHQGVSRSTMFRTLKQLETLGYVERIPSYRADGSRSSNTYRLLFDSWSGTRKGQQNGPSHQRHPPVSPVTPPRVTGDTPPVSPVTPPKRNLKTTNENRGRLWLGTTGDHTPEALTHPATPEVSAIAVRTLADTMPPPSGAAWCPEMGFLGVWVHGGRSIAVWGSPDPYHADYMRSNHLEDLRRASATLMARGDLPGEPLHLEIDVASPEPLLDPPEAA